MASSSTTSRYEDHVVLPNAPSFTTEDPLGLSDAEDFPTAAYPILQSYLLDKHQYFLEKESSEELASEFTTAISDLSYTLHKLPDPNLNLLKEAILSYDLSHIAISNILQAAGRLPALFPNKSIPTVMPSHQSLLSNASHLQNLFSHQFLSTMLSPSWNDWGGVNLNSWYSDADGNREPKLSYIKTALTFAASAPLLPMAGQDQLAEFIGSIPTDFIFQLHVSPAIPDIPPLAPLIPLKIVELPEESDFPVLRLEDSDGWNNTYIISSHEKIGHGPSGTQEERILASVPELLPVSIFTPPLENNMALCVNATNPMGFIPTAAFVGHGRTARLDKTYDSAEFRLGKSGRPRVNTFLFLNAVELDVVDAPEGSLPDFVKGAMEKDLLKAYTGFEGAFTYGISQNHRIIATPWGSGAFGGDIRVKLLLLWIAASFAAAERKKEGKTELIFLVKSLVLDVKEDGWREIVNKIEEKRVTATKLWSSLQVLRDQGGKLVFEGIRDILGL